VTWEDREKMSTESVRLAWPWRQWLGEGTSSQLWFFLWQLLFSRIIRSHTLCCNEFRISLGEIPLLLLFQAQSVHKGVYRHAAACRIFVVKTLKHLCAFVYWTSNYFYKYCLEDETGQLWSSRVLACWQFQLFFLIGQVPMWKYVPKSKYINILVASNSSFFRHLQISVVNIFP
jgi:hypothetical protein